MNYILKLWEISRDLEGFFFFTLGLTIFLYKLSSQFQPPKIFIFFRNFPKNYMQKRKSFPLISPDPPKLYFLWPPKKIMQNLQKQKLSICLLQIWLAARKAQFEINILQTVKKKRFWCAGVCMGGVIDFIRVMYESQTYGSFVSKFVLNKAQ